MYTIPKDPKKIRERIRRYERSMRKEENLHGFISDGAGKRYLLGPLYMLMGDIDGAITSFKWFNETFPDDTGEPMHYLCWTLALYKTGDLEGAAQKLHKTMLTNLYLIPYLFVKPLEELDIWHGSSDAWKEYISYIPEEIFHLWQWEDEAAEWVREKYQSPDFTRDRTRYIEIHRQLKDDPPDPKRSQLVNEASKLEDTF